MEIRGEDDFARLGTSFNEMAASLQQQIVQLEEFGVGPETLHLRRLARAPHPAHHCAHGG
ncbi:MAG: hypothetical protein U1U88_001982 [Lawsonella clevelandensis]